MLWVEDAQNDPRFSNNPLVKEGPGIRLYAGAPIFVDGQGVGSVCVIDTSPRSQDPRLAARLERLAAITAKRLIDYREIIRLKALKEHSPDAIVTLDGDGIVRGWNPAAAEIFGRSADEMLGQSGAPIMAEGDRAFRMAELHRLAEGLAPTFKGRVERVRGLRADGSEVTLEASYSLHRQGSAIRLSAIMRDCSEREARQRDLAAALASAEAGVTAKNAFLARMSHEIRTPLNAIVGLAHVIEHDGATEDLRHHAAIIQRSGLALKVLLDDVLAASRSADQAPLQALPLDLLALGASLVDLYTPAAEAKGLKIAFRQDSTCARFVLGDAARLRQVLSNLLSNAIKFTDQGRIDLILSTAQEGQALLEVRDTGIGFSDTVAESLFDPFFQVDETITRRFDGAGLGLSVSRDLARFMGGDIVAQGRPGQGASFFVRLPVPVAEQYAQRPAIGDEDVDAPQDQAPPLLAGLRVLVVDDNAVNRQVLLHILQDLGASVACAEDGQQALEAIDARPFDLILMDIHMPVVDGLEATRRLRAREKAQGAAATPVIVVSADDGEGCIAASSAAGAQAHLAKPVMPALLISAMVTAMT